ncbi:autotransporter-associated beta strand repeat-containing protein, partial [Salmonella enterica]|uniref:autotransporter-associated beta strand repeat-containing protein n=1 Tax=Salmonella enterica TaxID=28901 RepID=UPI000A18617C
HAGGLFFFFFFFFLSFFFFSGVLKVGEGELKNTLSGSGSLVKTGTGELTLSGDNTYSGGTTISDGTLIAASVNALGSGDIDNSGVLKVGEGE